MYLILSILFPWLQRICYFSLLFFPSIMSLVVGKARTANFATKRHSENFIFIMTLGGKAFSGPLSYLNGIQDLRSIGLVCKQLKDYYHDTSSARFLMERNFKKAMARFDLCWDHLMFLMYSKKMIIAGSIILQSATGIFYDSVHDSDVDMYISFFDQNDVVKFLSDHDYIFYAGWDPSESPDVDTTESCDSWTQFCHQNVLDIEYVNSYTRSVSTYMHRRSWLKVDVIVMQNSIPPRSAIAGYDFTFLMGAFDGSNFELLFPIDIMTRKGRYSTVNIYYVNVANSFLFVFTLFFVFCNYLLGQTPNLNDAMVGIEWDRSARPYAVLQCGSKN